jgi:hypothetical protein
MCAREERKHVLPILVPSSPKPSTQSRWSHTGHILFGLILRVFRYFATLYQLLKIHSGERSSRRKLDQKDVGKRNYRLLPLTTDNRLELVLLHSENNASRLGVINNLSASVYRTPRRHRWHRKFSCSHFSFVSPSWTFNYSSST